MIHANASDWWSQIFNFTDYGQLLVLLHNSILAGAMLGKFQSRRGFGRAGGFASGRMSTPALPCMNSRCGSGSACRISNSNSGA